MAICPRPDKRAHATAAAAEAAIVAMRTQAGRSGRDKTRWLSAYLCPCGSWHVGDQRPSLQRKITAAKLPPAKRGRP